MDELFNYREFYSFAAGHSAYALFAEVGVQKGGSISYLAKQLKTRNTPFKIYAVDLWERLGETGCAPESIEQFRPVFEARLAAEGIADSICAMQLSSADAAASFQNSYLDFVFIDANHGYEHVKADIAAWMPKIKSGGMISGHDYGEPSCGVKKAVDEVFGSQISTMGTCWWMIVP